MIKLRLKFVFRLINLFVGLLVLYLLVMVGGHVLVLFKEVLFLMMPLLV